MSENPISGDGVASRIAQRALVERGATYTGEVRRLLDAALEVMRQRGTTTRPRVADIVRAAGLSNDAFYRYFPSKDALVVALLEDGTERLRGYVAHQMSKEPTPEGKVRRWVEGVLSQAREEIGTNTRAVLWNAGAVSEVIGSTPPIASKRLAGLLAEPFGDLGSADPDFDASLAAYATFGKLGDYVWGGGEPTDDDVRRIADFCLRKISPAAPPS
ncbi:TetR family transcriptional regulator [Actinomadura sp. CNU-125]|uniref:TetR/AcrR family transcriptional regulator n=1 Tax=Actinomadura sp. CNU-125 TaxID=1904961 RepID=UPI000961401A|nr:TetR/AcrR family transcriptional regulator [Actinomadura sp. CNU-125]OLT21213.1 TetR family transcriptional regulator [Actinomadura sp. CNU-125]